MSYPFQGFVRLLTIHPRAFEKSLALTNLWLLHSGCNSSSRCRQPQVPILQMRCSKVQEWCLSVSRYQGCGRYFQSEGPCDQVLWTGGHRCGVQGQEHKSRGRDGSIFATFARIGQKVVSFSHRSTLATNPGEF